MLTPFSEAAYQILGFDEIHQRIGKRSVVSDASGQDEIDAPDNKLVHDSLTKDPLGDRLPESPRCGISC